MSNDKKILGNIFVLIPESKLESILSQFKSKRGLQCGQWELLGDKVINLSVCQHLLKHQPDSSIGTMTKKLSYLVSRDSFKSILNDWGFGTQRGWSAKKYGDLLETLVGLSYDLNRQWTEVFLIKLWNSYQYMYEEKRSNPKGFLQELLIGKGIRYHYDRLSVGKVFIVKLRIEDRDHYYGRGVNLKDAEKQAAFKALQDLETKGFGADTSQGSLEKK